MPTRAELESRPGIWTPALRLLGDEQIGGARMFSPKRYALIFQVGPDPAAMTMAGVKEPLDMIFLDRAYTVLGWVMAQPGEARVDSPKGTWTVVEVPAGTSRRWGVRRGQTMRVRSSSNPWRW